MGLTFPVRAQAGEAQNVQQVTSSVTQLLKASDLFQQSSTPFPCAGSQVLAALSTMHVVSGCRRERSGRRVCGGRAPALARLKQPFC
jgi:hypothetical protein